MACGFDLAQNSAGGFELGLKLETISRTFSKFAEDGIIEVKQRYVRILDSVALQRIATPQTCQ